MAQDLEIKVLSSVAIKYAYDELLPRFEAASGHKVATEWVGTVDMMARLRAGEAPDLAISSSDNVDTLIQEGKFASGSRVDFSRSAIGIAVRKGAARPDVGSREALVAALKASKSFAYSTGPSGAYLADLFERIGLADQAHKLKVVQGEPVGAVVARGEAEIGFQMVPELMFVPGIDYIGTLPAELGGVTIFAAGVPVASSARGGEAKAAQALLAFLRTPEAVAAFGRIGMGPG
jgi:molybdate transport system substrate-binding protein